MFANAETKDAAEPIVGPILARCEPDVGPMRARCEPDAAD